MDQFTPLCDWDAQNELIVLTATGPSRAPAFAAVAFPPDGAGDAAAGGRAEPIFLGEIAGGARLAALRAPRLSRFAVGLFPVRAEDGAAGAAGRRFERSRAAQLFHFDRALVYDPTRPDAPDRRTALRFFAPVFDALGEVAISTRMGEPLADGQRPGPFLQDLLTRHRASDDAGPIAVGARVSSGDAQGPSLRAYPAAAPALPARFDWAQEILTDPDTVVLPGFESLRAPMVEIDLTAAGALAERLRNSFAFFHAPLGPDGYRQMLEPERAGELEAVERNGRRRIVIRHIWRHAQHRDFIGFVFDGPHRIVADGALAGCDKALSSASRRMTAHAKHETYAACTLYLGETFRPEPSDADVEPEIAALQEKLDGAASEEERHRLTARLAPMLRVRGRNAEFAAVVEAARHGLLGVNEAEAADAYGLDWALGAAAGADLDGARSASTPPASLHAFFEARRSVIDADFAVGRALASLGATLESFQAYVDAAPIVTTLLARPALAASIAENFARPMERDAELRQPLPLLADALFGPDVARWAHGLDLDGQTAAWELLTLGAPLDAVAETDLTLEPGEAASAEEVATAVAAARSTEDRRAAASVLRRLERPASALLQAPITLRDAVAQASLIREAQAAIRTDRKVLAQAFHDVQLSEPSSVDELWVSAADEAAIDAELARADRPEITELRDAEGPLDQAFRRLATDVVRAEALRRMASFATEKELLDRIYAVVASAFDPERAERMEGAAARIAASADLAHLRAFMQQDGALAARPEWPCERYRKRQATYERDVLRRADVARAGAPGGVDAAGSGASGAALAGATPAASADPTAGALAERPDIPRAALRDVDALRDFHEWVAARRVWRDLVRDAHALAGRGKWIGLRARRVVAQLSGPPETWPALAEEIDSLATRADIAELRRAAARRDPEEAAEAQAAADAAAHPERRAVQAASASLNAGEAGGPRTPGYVFNRPQNARKESA